MAHYVADLIGKADSATGEEKRVAKKNCFDAILALWSHRAALPRGKRPFEELEPVVRAIKSLDPDDDTPRYFRSARTPAGDNRGELEVEAWLKMVDGLDYSAKILIRHCLSEAARTAINKSKAWVKLADLVGADAGVSGVVTRFVSSAGQTDQEPDLAVEGRRRAEDRLARLETFLKLAESVAHDWRGALKSEYAATRVRVGRDSNVKRPSRTRKRTRPNSA